MNAATHAIRRRRQDAGERPFIVIWESPRACPLACLHCRAEAVPDRDPRELDTAAAKDLLHQVAAFGQPAPAVRRHRRPLPARRLYGKTPQPAGTPKLSTAGPGRPTGMKNKHRAREHPVGKENKPNLVAATTVTGAA
ncbi:hypothetical protein ABZ835_48220 [Streptomyces sp. NPDC047461]|uniref:hypothetical protein n=1 Tax=Streptomyces sp. NPDC047461 TaxID=3155619 RepID=UPI0033D67D5E